MSSVRILPFRLREPKGLLVLAAYLGLSSALEAAVVYLAFVAPGLEDIMLIGPLGFWTFLVPACVVLALTLSLLHLTRSFYVAPGGPRARPKARARRKRRKKRKTRIRLDLSRLLRPLSSLTNRVARRLGDLGVAAVKGLGIALLSFSSAIMFILLLAYFPQLFLFSGFLAKETPFSALTSVITGLAEALASGSLKWLADGLVWASMGLSASLEPLWRGLAASDPLLRYAFAQNAIAWTSGLAAILYRRPPIRRR